MRAYRLLAVLVAGLAAVLVSGFSQSADGPSNARLGKKIDNFTLNDVSGKAFSLYDLKEKKAIVVVFLSFDCPVSTGYSPTLAKLAKEYGPLGVSFIGVCPCEDDAAQVAKHAKDFSIPFPS